MAVTKVIEIIKRVQYILNDTGAVRWKRVELQDWINDSYHDIIRLRPDANSKLATVSLKAGYKQSLDDVGSINLPSAIQILDVVQNTAASSTKGPISRGRVPVLDAILPDWRTATASVNISLWFFDMRLPNEFMVYPPAPASPVAQVDIVYSCLPTLHAISEANLDPAGANTEKISLDDIYTNNIVDYVLYRAFLKDAEGANGQRAAFHLQAFNDSLGGKSKIDVGFSPANYEKQGV